MAFTSWIFMGILTITGKKRSESTRIDFRPRVIWLRDEVFVGGGANQRWLLGTSSGSEKRTNYLTTLEPYLPSNTHHLKSKNWKTKTLVGASWISHMVGGQNIVCPMWLMVIISSGCQFIM